MTKFKNSIIVLLIFSVMLLPSCGKDTAGGNTLRDTTGSSVTEETITEEEETKELNPKELYFEYLKLLDGKNDDDSSYKFEFDKSKYAFVELPNHESPVMILFDGWRVFAFFEIVDGEVNPVKDSNGDNLIMGLVDDVYLYNGKIYLLGWSGAPAALSVFETNITDGESSLEQIIFARPEFPEFGISENVFQGKNEEIITREEFKSIIEPITEEGKKIGFISVNTVSDNNVSEAIEAFTDFMQSGEAEKYFTYVGGDGIGYLILTPDEYEIPLMIASDGMGLFRLFVCDSGEVLPAVTADGKEIVLPGNAGVFLKDNEICFRNSGGLPVNEIVNAVTYEDTAFTVNLIATKTPNDRWYEKQSFDYTVEGEVVTEEDYNEYVKSKASSPRIMDESGFAYS